MSDISVFGLKVRVIASNTFPTGFSGTEFADDADPFDLPSMQIADKAVGPNGDLMTWGTANPIEITLNVIPNSDFDQNLSILFDANRPGRGKSRAADNITMVGYYPNGDVITLSKGAITNGPPAPSAASSGRLKTNAYMFAFENVVRA